MKRFLAGIHESISAHTSKSELCQNPSRIWEDGAQKAYTMTGLEGLGMNEKSRATAVQPASLPKYEVFISYRRETGADVAGRIQEALMRRNRRAFLDTIDLKKGYYNKILLECIATTPNFVILLSHGALDRCLDEDDVLRGEIIQAHRTGRNIIPILMPGFQAPDAELPHEVADILQLQALEYDHTYFHILIDRLITLIDETSLRYSAGKREDGADPASTQQARQDSPLAVVAQEPQKRRRKRMIRSLAVLPFEATDVEAEYLSDGITENLINILSQLPKLRVMARGTVFRYKDIVEDPQQAGRELNVDSVLTGRIVQRKNTWIVAAELMDVANGFQIWGQRYTRIPTSMLEIEQQIAKDISRELRPRLAPKRKKDLFKRYTDNTEAYQLYLKGRYYWNQRTHDGLRKGIQYFQQAINEDNNYALAYAGLSDCFQLLGGYRILPPADAFSQAKSAATKALEIDKNLAEAHTSLALASLYFDWDWVKAEKGFKLAIRLRPSYATARQWYTHYLMAVGRPSQALTSIEEAHSLDPLSLVINTHLGWALYFVRRFEEAVEQLNKTIGLDPDYTLARFVLGQCYVRLARYPEAISEIQLAASLSGRLPSVLSALGYTRGLMGEGAEARKILDELHLLSAKRYVSAYDMALVHLGLGETDRVMEWLEKAFKERSSWMVWLKAEPVFDNLRSDPRFQRIVQDVGLP
jgi:TolB-like protein